MAFNAVVVQEQASISVAFQGVLDEHATLPQIPMGSILIIDLQELSYINSVGARMWIKWLQEVSNGGRVVLQNCPVLFVKNLSAIRGMINKNTQVESFYVPYYDEHNHERKNILFRKNIHFFQDGTVKLPGLLDSAGDPMEPDIIMETYFLFLKL